MVNEPKDITAFVKSWSSRVRSTLRKFGVRNTELLNDLEQDVYVRMIEKKTLETFKPTQTF
ncbi:unnamed protein product [marine sediment metagenome]|uniref:RNA polymerase sigma-70 region 2 domain-containing protein n=1 Tax=marine sediment metagenome TaxID=412755 RepID=X1KBU1_9ZZZZ